MNAKQKQEKAKIREDLKKQLSAKGIPRERAERLIDEVEDKGWAWTAEQTAEGAGILVCSWGTVAVIRNPERFSQNCPNCKRPWKIAEVQ